MYRQTGHSLERFFTTHILARRPAFGIVLSQYHSDECRIPHSSDTQPALPSTDDLLTDSRTESRLKLLSSSGRSTLAAQI